ncbi:MAG: P-loop NTPase [Candidatus Micrarchaeia archaeon]
MEENATAGKTNPDKASTASSYNAFIAGVLSKKNMVKANLEKVKHKVGVYSAKGGVGKTTIAINLAYALKELGYKVGILDADVDTPNVAVFLGISEKAEGAYPLKPLEKDGIKIISTTMFTDDAARPIIWRGPLIAKMVEDFMENTAWGELDYLVIDLPPGTSDAPLSVMQLLELDGFVLVTTPQHIAALNAIRSGRMARRLGVGILGVVENMSSGTPAGAKEVADALGVNVLGTVKTNSKFDELSDSGKVPVEEDKEIRQEFISIASKLIK